MALDWLTSSKAKSIATVLPAVGSLIAVVIASFKPTGVDSSAKAYEIVRAELVSQREEILKVHKDLVELDAWFRVWREYQDAHAQRVRDQRLQASRSSRSPASSIDKIDNMEDLQEVPPPPPRITDPPAAKPPLPPAKAIF